MVNKTLSRISFTGMILCLIIHGHELLTFGLFSSYVSPIWLLGTIGLGILSYYNLIKYLKNNEK